VVGELKNTKGREEEREKELVAELGVVTTCSSEIRFRARKERRESITDAVTESLSG